MKVRIYNQIKITELVSYQLSGFELFCFVKQSIKIYRLYHMQKQNQKMKSQIEEILEKYTYKKDKPHFSANNYNVWQANQAETNLAVTIKIVKYPHIELAKYLKKLKQVKSEFVIKVYEVVADQSSLMIITEQVTFATLKKALITCQHLDQNDSIFVAKALLSGHVDMLRSDCNWFGTEDDIQFTDTGIKMSWNNSCQFNLVNPFPTIIGKLSARTQVSKGEALLPFPEIKAISELIKISKQNASQISLHPQMKQKIKFSRRKGKDWMGLREVKNKNQYFDELSYLSVSREHGFVRVKVFELGKISPNLLMLNTTKNTFTKILDVYDEGDKTIILSAYSNDGNLQSYVKRLKSAGMSLKEEHIQFFFFSLFEPIKGVQESTLKSINMLHIKNIYIENGIPKIGEPIPINNKIVEVLADRSDVPDFYKAEFKKDPTSHNVTYDTYSCGVLLYKLMYTEYPIFPNGKVHIPTTPNYNNRLKTSLQLLLNEGGSLADLEKQIEISENVLKQVQQNKEKLLVEGGKQIIVKKSAEQEQNEHESQKQVETISKISIVEQNNEDDSESSDDEDGCKHIILQKLKLKPAQKMKQCYTFLDKLQQSSYRKCRIWTKAVLVLLVYIFLFYYNFIVNDVALLSNYNLLQSIPVTANSNTYNIVTTNYYSFVTTFTATNQTLNDILNMGCLIDSYRGAPVYSSTAYNSSSIWTAFIFCGLLTLIVNLIMKVVQINALDSIRAWNYRQNGKGKFNFTNFILFNLMFQTLLAGHFYFFNLIYYSSTDPCLTFPNGVEYGSSDYLFSNKSVFTKIYMAVYISQFLFTLIYLIVIDRNQKIQYNKIINPIVIFGGAYFIFVLIVRLGAIMKSYYYPSPANDPTNILASIFKSGNIMGIIGVFPQILLIIELVLSTVIDLLFWGVIDKTHSLLSNDASIMNEGLQDIA